MDCLTLKRRNSFQNQNKENPHTVCSQTSDFQAVTRSFKIQ